MFVDYVATPSLRQKSISDNSDASLLVSFVCGEVEGLTVDLGSPPISREVVYHPENSSLFHPNYPDKAEFSMDVDIEPEDAPIDVPRGKSIFHSLNTKNKLFFKRVLIRKLVEKDVG